MSSEPTGAFTGFEFCLAAFCRRTAAEMSLAIGQIEGTARLLEDGNTIPFIARYRKEATRGLDERQLRTIEDLLARAKELATRKNTILKTIHELGKMTALSCAFSPAANSSCASASLLLNKPLG